MKTPKITYYHIFGIVYLLFLAFYIINICNYNEVKMVWTGFIIFLLSFLMYRLVNKNFKDIIIPIVLIWFCSTILPHAILKRFFYHYDGISIIRLAKIDGVNPTKSYHQGSSKVIYTDYDSTRIESIYGLTRLTKGTDIYVIHPLECSSPVYKEYKDTINYSQIHDFAFLDDKDFYTYHDFSLIKPDLVYYQVGYNILYYAVCNTPSIADSTALLSFTDVLGKNQTVKYSVKGYSTIPDIFLVYRNINEKIDSVWHVCAPEVNTPENRAKISDYGYIFHYDVYSKQEIESQCPRIKEYVEQYKKRNQ